jgi:hypothetical protein
VRCGRLVLAGVLGTALVVTTAVAGCATPALPLTTMAPGWEQYFGVTWETAQRGGGTVLRGEVTNQFSMVADRVRLLVEDLDAGGQITGQRVIWVGRPIGPAQQSYFETPVPGTAASYRVSVYSFSWQRTN